MKSLFRKIISHFNKSNGTSRSESTQHETNTNVHTISFDLNLDTWTPRPREPIPPKAVYDYDEALSIGMTVEFRRKYLKLTQKQLSDLLGYKSTSFVSKLELG